MSSENYARIRGNPKYAGLVASRKRANGALFASSMIVYLGFIATVAFAPDLLRTPLWAGGVATVAWPVGAAVVIFSWCLTLLYVRLSDAHAKVLQQIFKEVGL